jgi:hypothetical protein
MMDIIIVVRMIVGTLTMMSPVLRMISLVGGGNDESEDDKNCVESPSMPCDIVMTVVMSSRVILISYQRMRQWWGVPFMMKNLMNPFCTEPCKCVKIVTNNHCLTITLAYLLLVYLTI